MDRIPNISIGGEQLQLTSFVDSSQTFDKMQTGVHGAQDSPAYQHRPMKQDWGAFTHPELYNSATAGSDSSEISWLAVDAPIKHVPPTCVLDGILLHLIHERRQCAAEYVSYIMSFLAFDTASVPVPPEPLERDLNIDYKHEILTLALV